VSADPRRPSRRGFLGLAGLAGGGLAAGSLAGCTGDPAPAAHDSSTAGGGPTAGAGPTPTSARVAASGPHQAGVVTPRPPQPNLLGIVYDLAPSADPATVLAALGRTVLELTAGRDPKLAGLDPGDLTVTVGVGPRLVAAVDAGLPGAEALPRFGGHESLAEHGLGGDLFVQLCASDPLVLPGAAAAVAGAGGSALTERWRQRAFRGPNVPISRTASAPRNLLGFVDGIIGPRTDAEFDADVWLTGPARVAGGSIVAVRRMEIDLARFTALGEAEQEQVFGRRRSGAQPLSGGTIATDPDLGAKTPAGAYLIPADAHLRRANPGSTGVPPMLRRSYSFADTSPGLLFVSYQNALHTFVATLTRMTTSDALLPYTTTTHAATFLVLPGFDRSHPLGSTLFG
jgi:dye decolorizing peroxidase